MSVGAKFGAWKKMKGLIRVLNRLNFFTRRNKNCHSWTEAPKLSSSGRNKYTYFSAFESLRLALSGSGGNELHWSCRRLNILNVGHGQGLAIESKKNLGRVLRTLGITICEEAAQELQKHFAHNLHRKSSDSRIRLASS